MGVINSLHTFVAKYGEGCVYSARVWSMESKDIVVGTYTSTSNK